MADLLSIGTSGINVYRKSLSTVGNNIANVDTAGYSRQTHETIQDVQDGGKITIGSGVLTDRIKRAYDSYATGAYRNSTSLLTQQDALYSYARKLENVLGDKNMSLTSATDRFFAAAHDLSISPSSTTAREALLDEGVAVVERFKSLSSQFAQIDNDSFVEIENRINELNTLSKQLAVVNQSLLQKADINTQPGGLVDQRDQLLQKMSSLVSISTSQKDNGVVTVYLGSSASGNTIVDVTTARDLSVERNANDPEKINFILDPFGKPAVVDNMSGGTISGIRDFRNEALTQARINLDVIATGFMNAVNEVQKTGFDASGEFGRDMFVVENATDRVASVMKMALSGGDDIATGAPLMINQNGSLSALKLSSWAPPSVNELNAGERSIQSVWSSDPAASIAIDAGDTPAFVIQGNSTRDLSLSIDESGGAVVQVFTRDGRHIFGSDLENDASLVGIMTKGNGFKTDVTGYNNTYLNANELNSYKDAFEITTDPQGVKTLNIKGQITDDLLVFVTGNGTSAEFSGAWYPPEESLNKQQMVSSVRIDFIDSSTYTITDETTQTSIATRSYSSGDTIELNGWKAVLENTPVQGDRFTISLNTAARGDNRNMHVMTALQTDRAVFQGRGNFSEVYSDLINELGSVVVQSSISRDAQQVLTDEAKQARDSVSAVSLDEEAADLLRFQQAYQASAQVIQAANKLFDSILALR